MLTIRVSLAGYIHRMNRIADLWAAGGMRDCYELAELVQGGYCSCEHCYHWRNS